MTKRNRFRKLHSCIKTKQESRQYSLLNAFTPSENEKDQRQITVHKRSCGKVMFSEVCIKNSVNGGGGMCGAQSFCMVGGHEWQGACVAGGHAQQEIRPLQRTVRILLECILVFKYFRFLFGSVWMGPKQSYFLREINWFQWLLKWMMNDGASDNTKATIDTCVMFVWKWTRLLSEVWRISTNNNCRSGTVNSNTVNSKFHLIRSFCEIFARFLSFNV